MKSLKEYMFEHDLKITDLAVLLGYNYTLMTGVVSGKKKPSERLQYKINKLLNTKDIPDLEKKCEINPLIIKSKQSFTKEKKE